MSRNVSGEVGLSRVEILDLPSLVAGLPAVPPQELDPCLDAAYRCFERHGVGRTTVPDIAREMRVSRATVYRKVGTVESAARLLLSREIHRLLSEVAGQMDPARSGPDEIVDMMVWLAERADAHPVLAKVRESDAEMIGPFLTEHFAEVVTRASAGVEPLLVVAMDSGRMAQRDPAVMAEWLVRIMISVALAPPAVDLRSFLEAMVVPVLAPELQVTKARRRPASRSRRPGGKS